MKIDTSDLLKKGWELEDRIEALMTERRANRELLRLCEANEGLSDKEKEELTELYPVRERNRTSDDEIVED